MGPLWRPYHVFDYIGMFYNLKRKHARNGMRSPVDFEWQQKLRLLSLVSLLIP